MKKCLNEHTAQQNSIQTRNPMNSLLKCISLQPLVVDKWRGYKLEKGVGVGKVRFITFIHERTSAFILTH